MSQDPYIPPPRGWTPPIEPVQSIPPQPFTNKVIPPPIGSGSTYLMHSQPIKPEVWPAIGSGTSLVPIQSISPEIWPTPGGLSGPTIPPPIGGPPASEALGPYAQNGSYRYGNYPPPVGSSPAAHPITPPIGADADIVLASQPIQPPVGAEAANLLGQPLPPPMGYAPSTDPNRQMIPPPIGGPSAKQLRGDRS